MKKIHLTQETLDKWAEMTNANEHIEVRIEIAEFFDIHHDGDKYLDYASAWKQYKALVKASGREALTASCILCRAMLAEIGEQYGVGVAMRVSDCL